MQVEAVIALVRFLPRCFHWPRDAPPSQQSTHTGFPIILVLPSPLMYIHNTQHPSLLFRNIALLCTMISSML